jgi:hypothetical protein
VLLRGAYNLSPGATLVGGSLRVSGDRMVFRQRGGCDIPKPSKQPKPQTAADRKLGPAGTYRWRLRGRSLSFAAVGDRCAARKRQLTSLQWQLQLKRRRR